MDFFCESQNDVDVQNDHALRFAVVTKPAPVVEYLKTIASLIGASHILGVFEATDFIKVYFDDKKYVDTLIRKGIHVMGHHIKVDYAVPPGKKVILLNIDPVVTNSDLIKLMSTFGSVVSPIFRSPISDDVELCHIDCGVRYFYMNFHTTVPNILEFKYGDQLCKIIVKIEENVSAVTFVKNDPTESNVIESSSNPSPLDADDEPINVVDYDNELDITEPVVISVQSANEGGSDQRNEIQSHMEISKPVVSKKLRKARGSRFTSQINKKMKQNLRFKHRRAKRFIIKRKKQIKVCSKQTPQTPLIKETSPSVSSLSPCDSSTPLPPINESFISKNSRFILEEDKLTSFLEESRYHHAPIELVKKYIGPDFDSNALICLIVQLNDYRKRLVEDPTVKNRIYRLAKTLRNFATDQ